MGCFCRGCRYDLSGRAASPGEGAALCSECGRPFDPSDPRSTLRSPRIWRRPWVVKTARSGAVLCALLLCFWLTWIPRPLDTRWRMWVWLGKEYGVSTGVSRAGRTLELHVRADELVKIIGRDASGAMVYRVRRLGENRHRVEALSAGVVWQEIDGALRRMGAPAGRVVFGGEAAPPGPFAPFTAEGDATAIGEALLRGFNVRPAIIIRRLADDLWEMDLIDPAQVGVDEVFGAFNSLRDHVYGVRAEPGEATPPPAPMRVKGSEADIFWAVMNGYGRVVDRPDLVPPTSAGWHPTGVYSPDPRPIERERPTPVQQAPPVGAPRPRR